MVLKFWNMRTISFLSYCLILAIPCVLSNVTVKHAIVPQEGRKRYRTGETFVMGCQIGYKPVGNGTQECSEGNWTAQEFYCESK